jgi:CMP-N-acetylneuraminic acid synthetase/regulator of RNase E activity RraA
MVKKPRVVAFVPAKSSSDRVVNKNTRPFNGEPFFLFTVHKLVQCEFIDEVYIDSDSPEILAQGERAGAKPLARDPALASNTTDGNALFMNEVNFADADIYIQHLCTSPFITKQTIREAVETLMTDSEVDSVVLARKEKQYLWHNGQPAYRIDPIPNSVDLPDTISEAMGLYVITKDAAIKTRRRIGERPKLIHGKPIELVDVNTEEDMNLARTIGAGLLAEEEKQLRIIGAFLSSPLLSDIADELGIDCVLPPLYKANFPHAKLFGRARTLHIRAATEEDDPASIYKALQSYKTVVSNDIIVVQNDEPELAYFGDLNMSLAIRSGAVGALIGGVTRDTKNTVASGFPVYAKGSYCRDIKGKGAVASINQPITIDGMKIMPSDLIFADNDGVVVIPRKVETEMLNRAIKNYRKESNIIQDICSDIAVDSIVDRHGFF